MKTLKSFFFALALIISATTLTFAGGEETESFIDLEHEVVLLVGEKGSELDVQFDGPKSSRIITVSFQDAEEEVSITVYTEEDGIIYSENVTGDYSKDFDFAYMGRGQYHVLIESGNQSITKVFEVR